MVAGGGEGGFLLGHVGEELGDGHGRRRGVQRAKALGRLAEERDGGEEEGEGEELVHGCCLVRITNGKGGGDGRAGRDAHLSRKRRGEEGAPGSRADGEGLRVVGSCPWSQGGEGVWA